MECCEGLAMWEKERRFKQGKITQALSGVQVCGTCSSEVREGVHHHAAMKRRATRGGSLPGDHRASVRVTVVQATGLAAAKSSSKSRAKAKGRDVYALLRIGTIERRTATVKGSLAPRFDGVSERLGLSLQEPTLARISQLADRLEEAAADRRGNI